MLHQTCQVARNASTKHRRVGAMESLCFHYSNSKLLLEATKGGFPGKSGTSIISADGDMNTMPDSERVGKKAGCHRFRQVQSKELLSVNATQRTLEDASSNVVLPMPITAHPPNTDESQNISPGLLIILRAFQDGVAEITAGNKAILKAVTAMSRRGAVITKSQQRMEAKALTQEARGNQASPHGSFAKPAKYKPVKSSTMQVLGNPSALAKGTGSPSDGMLLRSDQGPMLL